VERKYDNTFRNHDADGIQYSLEHGSGRKRAEGQKRHLKVVWGVVQNQPRLKQNQRRLETALATALLEQEGESGEVKDVSA
jgi:hypothetical protein